MRTERQENVGPSITRMRDSWQHHSQKIFIGLAVVLGLGMVSFFSGAGSMSNTRNTEETHNDAVVATAAGTDIHERQLDQAIQASSFARDSVDPRAKLQMKAYSLQAFIDQAIKVEAAKKANITVTPQEVKAEKDRIFKENFEPQLASLSKEDRARFEPSLRDRLNEQEQEIGDNLLVKKWTDSLSNKLNPNDPKTPLSDIEVRARHILIKVKNKKVPVAPGTKPKDMPLSDADAKKKAEKILAEVKKPGADFAALAKKYSQDPGSAEQGGDLNWFGQGRMVPAFQQAAFALKPGQTSGLVKTDFGYHIIKVEDRRISDEAKRKLVDDYMNKARPTAQVSISDDVLKALRTLNEAEMPPTDPTAKPDPKKKTQKYKEALAILEKARDKDPANAALQGVLGDTYKKLYEDGGKKDKALRDKATAAYAAAVEKTPAPRLRVDLAHLYEDEGQKPKAVEQLKKAAEVAYTDPSIRSDIQSSFERLGEKQLAAEQKKTMDELQKNQNPMGGGVPIHIPAPTPKR